MKVSILTISIFYIFILSANGELLKLSTGKKVWGHRLGLSLGLGPMKSYMNGQYDLKKREPVNLYNVPELNLYKTLVFQSLVPKYILLELTHYPYLHLATYLNESEHQFFDEFDLSLPYDKSVNILEIISGGGEKPFCISLFLGEIIPFFRGDRKDKDSQTGYALGGFVSTYSPRRIKKFMVLPDNWFELLYKLKGVRDREKDDIQWRFEFGGIVHDNSEFINSFELYLMREHKSKEMPAFSLLKNVRYEYIAQSAMWDYRSIWNLFIMQDLSIVKYFPQIKLSIEFEIKYERFRNIEKSNFVGFESNWSYYISPLIAF